MNPGSHMQILFCEYCGSSMTMIPLSQQGKGNRTPKLQGKANESDKMWKNDQVSLMSQKTISNFQKVRFSNPKIPAIIGLSVILASIVCANHASEMIVLLGGIVLSMALLAKEVDNDAKAERSIEAKPIRIDMRGDLASKWERRKAA